MLSNHLGNVLATVSDKKIAVMNGANLSYYRADVVSYSDYYPFGAPMTERTASVTPTDVRYGFNGKEVDSEINGNGNAYDFGARMYDSRLGRFLLVDPKFTMNPEFSAYQFAGLNPIANIDKLGQNWFYYQAEGSDKPSWYWHQGARVEVNTSDGLPKRITSEIETLVFFEMSNRSDHGPTTGAIKIYNQNTIVESSQEAGSGAGREYDHIEVGVYMMKLGTRNAPATKLNDAGDNLQPAFGIQAVPELAFDAYGGSANPQGAYGRGRIRLNPTNWNGIKTNEELAIVKSPDRGYYVHGRLKQGLATAGCVADKQEIVYNYFQTGEGSQIRSNVPFVATSDSKQVSIDGTLNEYTVKALKPKEFISLITTEPQMKK
jgi:RHS repeat-associated protein